MNFIGGHWVAPASGEFIPNINPATEEDLGRFPNSGPVDARAAVEAAAAAQPSWAALSSHTRGEYLRKAADILESRVDQVARDLMSEEGKSLPEAKGETLRAVTILRFYASETMRPEGEVIPSAGANTFLYTGRVPLGVCGLITPWNFPIAIPVWKAAPALAFGNTVVLKPSEHSPLTAYNIASCLEEAGIPAGVFNVIFGEGAKCGEALITHPSTCAISFTGSVRTGKSIAAQAVANGKKYQLEMGGKNAAVTLADANLEQAVNLTIQGAFKSAGQKCTATSRAIVHKDVYDQFRSALVNKTQKLTLGPGDDASAYLGPVITAQAKDNILSAVAVAKSEGASVLCGPETNLPRGYFVSPVVLDNVQPSMRIAREEVFGPVLCLMKAESEDHALEILNGVDYGLSASIFTSNLNSAMAFAERAQAGMVRINGETAGVEPQAPFGGMKASSSFSREQGLAAREFFTQIKTISVDRSA